MIGLGLVIATAAGCGTDLPGGGAREPDEVRVPAEFRTGFDGVSVGVQVAFEEDVHLSAVRLHSGDASQRIGIYPLTGTDPEPPPESMDLAAGDQVLLEGVVTPPCDGSATPRPIFVSSLAGRADRRFVPSNATDFERAVTAWCAHPPAVRSRLVTSFPDGRYRVTLDVSNPGPETAVVRLRPTTGARGSWNAARLAAPPGRTTKLVVTGRGPKDCRVDAPWKDGHLTVDGRPVRLPLQEWCG